MALRVQAEIAGTVHSIECREGQDVGADDILLILESMKMEIPVVAPASGRVAAIAVAPGDVVQEGQVLATLEA